MTRAKPAPSHRKHLVWILGLALALGISGVADAVSTAHFEASVSPSKLPRNNFKGVTARPHAFITAASGVGLAPDIPAQVKTVDIDLDENVKFTTRGLPQCDVNAIAKLPTDQAIAACRESVVGHGYATAQCSGGLTVPAVMTELNGVPSDGDPTTIIHTYAASMSTVIAVVRTHIDSPKPGFGTREHYEFDPLLGGACTLVDLRATLKKTYEFNGKKRSYLSARCKSKERGLKLSSNWTFYFGAPPQNNVTAKVPCKPRK